VARSLTITRKMLNVWRNAFRAEGLAGLGSNATLGAATVGRPRRS
jgi:transposase-like protein